MGHLMLCFHFHYNDIKFVKHIKSPTNAELEGEKK